MSASGEQQYHGEGPSILPGYSRQEQPIYKKPASSKAGGNKSMMMLDSKKKDRSQGFYIPVAPVTETPRCFGEKIMLITAIVASLISAGICIVGVACAQFGWWYAEYVPSPFVDSYVKAKGGLLQFKFSYYWGTDYADMNSYTSYQDYDSSDGLQKMGIATMVVFLICAVVELATFLYFAIRYSNYKNPNTRSTTTTALGWFAFFNFVVFVLVLAFVIGFYLAAQHYFGKDLTAAGNSSSASLSMSHYLGPHPGFNVWMSGFGSIFPLGVFGLCLLMRKDLKDSNGAAPTARKSSSTRKSKSAEDLESGNHVKKPTYNDDYHKKSTNDNTEDINNNGMGGKPAPRRLQLNHDLSLTSSSSMEQ
eukprot:Nk52_evm53s242 gene=Nk52_evmTU53s242